MRLPNGDRAVVDDAKLVNYCLSPTHARGRHKAKLFAAKLGFTRHHSIMLRTALLAAARNADAVEIRRNAHGQMYEIRFECAGPIGKATLLSVWISLDSDEIPRLVTCYPL
jgi:hypothetical protein